jgi:hypothetical protein
LTLALKMTYFQKRTIQGAVLVMAVLALGGLVARAQEAVSPPPKPQIKPDNPALRSSGKPSGVPNSPQIKPQELERLEKAADKVINRIQSEESDLYLRVSYFEKPSRLDPNSYASRDEVAQWQGMLQQLKEKHDLVAQLYADVGKDLEAELLNTSASGEAAARFKKYIMDGFPWETIEKKNSLLTDFIDEQAKLLSFYEKNWGSWTRGSDSNKPEFASASAANIYKRLRDQILKTSEELEREYKAISE